MPAQMFRVSEVSRMLRMDRKTVYRLIDSGTLRSYRIGASLRVSEDDLNALLRSSLSKRS